jgi:hypothetical protein
MNSDPQRIERGRWPGIGAALAIAVTAAALVAEVIFHPSPATAAATDQQRAAGLRFEISFPSSGAKEPQTGHIILVI